MALFEIKSRWNGSALFSLECGSLKLCVEAAVNARANLTGANLARANLTGANLTGANLTGANLTGANLTGANLARANLARANLDGANLARANLARANLDGANLDGANLAGATLTRANLDEANLAGAKLIGERPILQIGPIGSRNDWLIAFNTDAGVKVSTGCFSGAISDFRAKVAAAHGDNDHARHYEAAVSLIETILSAPIVADKTAE